MSDASSLPGLPPPHRVARRLASSGLRGASWYWRLARLVTADPAPGMVGLPDGTPIVHDPTDWTCRGSYEGTYEREVLRLLPDLVEPGDVVVDVGANVGIHTARLAHLVGPAGRVVAVEPSPRCLDDLHRVVDHLDDPHNVSVVQAALGATEGTVTLTGWDNPDHRGLGTAVPGHRAGLEENWYDGRPVEVPLRRLADVVAEHAGDREVGLLKVDVEGRPTCSPPGACVRPSWRSRPTSTPRGRPTWWPPRPGTGRSPSAKGDGRFDGPTSSRSMPLERRPARTSGTSCCDGPTDESGRSGRVHHR